MAMRRIFAALLAALLLWPLGAAAQQGRTDLASAAETMRSGLVKAQLDLTRDPKAAQAATLASLNAYDAALAQPLRQSAPDEAARIASGWTAAQAALDAGDGPAFAAARGRIWTGLLAGSYQIVADAVRAGDGPTAQAWLTVREFRVATRFSRPAADATIAVAALTAGTSAPADALLALNADLLDTYQARLGETLHALHLAAEKGHPVQQAEAGALAEGYFAIIEPAYRDQRGAAATDQARAAFAALSAAAGGKGDLPAALVAAEQSLSGFRAAPLSSAEQLRRAGQLLRFLALVPVEYGRGVKDGVVTRDLEIQEATTFRNGAAAAFADLESLLQARDAAKTAEIAAGLQQLEAYLIAASKHTNVPSADEVEAATKRVDGMLRAVMPAEWLKTDLNGDFDVIASMLDQMETAAAAGEYDLAESARLEAYAVLEAGPEARIIVFAPQYKVPLEDLFWYGQGDNKGLAHLISKDAPLAEIKASRKALDGELAAAQKALGGSNAPVAVATNAAIIVFREGLEAVLILASLMGSMKLGENRRLRRPIWIGAAGAFVFSALTWVLAQSLLQALARYGERLEAIVSLVAIGVLLLITNWFFHKVYWTGWMANFHTKKRRIVGGETGLWLGLVALGFSSIYREGFESVLFLQALVLEAGSGVVLGGVALGLGGAFLIGILVFLLQAKLPHKKMLVVTGVMIGVVLLVMVGNTVHVLQVVGWLPIHPIRSLTLPYWSGLWFGFFATWEGIALQLAAGTFVVGSYVLAEHLQHRRARIAIKQQAAGLAMRSESAPPEHGAKQQAA